MKLFCVWTSSSRGGLKIFPFNSGGHFVWLSGTICVNLVVGIYKEHLC